MMLQPSTPFFSCHSMNLEVWHLLLLGLPFELRSQEVGSVLNTKIICFTSYYMFDLVTFLDALKKVDAAAA